MTANPYSSYVDGIDVLASLEGTAGRIAALVEGWSPEAFERTYAPGKWTARQLIIHLFHTEMMFGERARFGVNTPGYVVTPFDQDAWMALDGAADARSALSAYLGTRRMNLAFFRSLTAVQLARPFEHPERGRIDVAWIVTALAGHERHHLPQLEQIAALRPE